jgi:hypothetical protein
MASKAYFIGPYESGLVKSTKPWLLTEDAFSLLQNAYVWRGRVKKRVGSRLFTASGTGSAYEHLLSRLRIKVGTTDGNGDLSSAVPGASGAVGQIFSIGTALYTVTTAGVAQPMLETVATTTATFDTTNGAFVFVGAPALTDVYWYPALPVMGIMNYEVSNISDEPVVAFDQNFAYERSGSGWDRLGTASWAGSNSQFFSGTNYRGTLNDAYWLFVVNNNQADQIKYWNGAAWATVAPATRVTANYTLHSARLIVSFKNRLVLLNTIEQVGAALPAKNFSNRARWCQNGDPVAADAWYDNVPGKGGWIEAPTREAIITAQILKDRLIVYFERSTWELVYTGNQVLPFIWQTIDDQLGAESTFSSVLLENTLLGIGETGVHECDGLRVSRIDENIPQEVFRIHNDNSGVERVAGVRDYINELVYWSFPNLEDNPVFPTRMLVYNYKNKSWSFNDDSITAFGHYQNEDDLTWGACTYTWEEFHRLWRSGLNQSKTKNVIAGNQEGFTFIMDSGKNDNAASLQITNITVPGDISLQVIDHNLKQNDFINIEFVQGITNIDGIFKVKAITDEDNFTVAPGDAPVGTYTGGGVISRVSKIDIRTKEFNFYQEAQRVSINKVDFDVDRSSFGNINVGFYSSTSETNVAQRAIDNGVNLGNYTLDTYPYALYPQEDNQNRLIRPVYIQAEGDCLQLQLTWTDAQMLDADNMKSTFELNSMTFYASPTGRRL